MESNSKPRPGCIAQQISILPGTRYITLQMALSPSNSTEENEIRREILVTLLHRIEAKLFPY